MKDKSRMLGCLLLSVLLFTVSYATAHADPTSLVAVSLFKAHLMSLAGWGGYWLDRWAFPYSRPHQHLADVEDAELHGSPAHASGDAFALTTLSATAEWAMLRRALIMVGCLICVGLGA
jgi:Putative 2/3 transmembrane domain holin